MRVPIQNRRARGVAPPGPQTPRGTSGPSGRGGSSRASRRGPSARCAARGPPRSLGSVFQNDFVFFLFLSVFQLNVGVVFKFEIKHSILDLRNLIIKICFDFSQKLATKSTNLDTVLHFLDFFAIMKISSNNYY